MSGTTISHTAVEHSEDAHKILAMRMLRLGDPFPFIRHEWPDLIITDPIEKAQFAKYLLRTTDLDLRIDDFQYDAIKSVFDQKHTQLYMSGGTKLGKGMIVGGLIVNIWFSLYAESSKIILVGPTTDHLKRNLFAEACKWRVMMTSYKAKQDDTEVLKESIEDPKNRAHLIALANTQSGEGMSGNHCHDDITEVMTDRGWMLFKDLDGTEQLLTMDPDSKECHFEFPSLLHVGDSPGSMWECDDKYVNFCVTGNHRMLYYGDKAKKPVFKEADEFFSGSLNNKHTHQAVNLQAVEPLFHRIPELSSRCKFFKSKLAKMDDWCRLAGWFTSEGHVVFARGVPSAVVISQKKKENFADIRRAMSPFGQVREADGDDGAVNFCVSSVQLATHVLREMGHLAENKKCPRDIFSASPRQMRLFLGSHLAGDGYTRRKSGRSRKGQQSVHYTCSTRLASDIHALRTLCGEYASVNNHFKAGSQSKIRGRTITANFDMNAVVSGAKQHKTHWRGRAVARVPYSGKVYCATMPSFGTLLTRRHGKTLWSGNSNATLFIFDESSGVDKDHYNNALSQCRFLIAISNPRFPSGWFYDGFPKEFDSGMKTINASTGPRRVISIGGIHCINVRAQRLMTNIGPLGGITIDGRFFAEGQIIPRELHHLTAPLIPGQVCYDLCKVLEASRPRDEVLWAVFGKFPRANMEFMLFRPEWKDSNDVTRKKNFQLIKPEAIGFDVAASATGDYSAIAFGNVYGCSELCVTRLPNLMDLKGHFYGLCRNRGIDPRSGLVPIAIDSIGVGKGLADSLELDGCTVLRVENGRAAEHNKEQYQNRRAECYGELADAMSPGIREEPFTVPDDHSLWEELFAVEKIYAPAGRQFKIIPKRRAPSQRATPITDNRQSIEEKIGRSPDKSDAVAMLWQAVQLLPDYGEQALHQFNPEMTIARYEVEEMGLFKIYRVLFMNGKSVDYTEQEFVELFGPNPPTYDYQERAGELTEMFNSMTAGSFNAPVV